MLPHPSTSFEIQNFYQNETRYNDIYSKNDFPKRQNGAFVKNLDEYK